MIKRIRGVAYTSKVSPALGNRAIEAVKGQFIEIHSGHLHFSDQNMGKNAGNNFNG